MILYFSALEAVNSQRVFKFLVEMLLKINLRAK